MNYKSIYYLQKSGFNSIPDNTNKDIDFFTSDINEDSELTFYDATEDDEYKKFILNIKEGAKGLHIISHFDDEKVLESLSFFKDSDFYTRKDIHDILLNHETYDILVDIVNINPSNDIDFQYEPRDIDIEILNEAFKVIIFMTKNSELATKKIFILNFIDIFFRNINYYRNSNVFLSRGLKVVTNLFHDLPISYDRAECVTTKYFSPIFKFIENFYENHKTNFESIKDEFYLIFAFSTSIPSCERLEQARRQKETTYDKVKLVLQIAEKSVITITNFLNDYEFIDSEEATDLFRSIYVLCFKFPKNCRYLLENDLSPFLKILSSENEESIEIAIDFFILIYEKEIIDKIEILKLFQWDTILENLSEEPAWIMSFLEFVDLSSDYYDFLWDCDVYQQIIQNFENFTYVIRNRISLLFSKLVQKIPINMVIDFLFKNNLFLIFFAILEEEDDIDKIGEILQALKIINRNVATVGQISLIEQYYDEFDAQNIFENLPADFSSELNEIYESMS